MTIIYVVLPLALIVVGAAVAAFVWAARQGQFDDLETPAIRMLYDDPVRGSTPRDSGDVHAPQSPHGQEEKPAEDDH
jgi:cbb3-type cytochrome oxidase maturation protein